MLLHDWETLCGDSSKECVSEIERSLVRGWPGQGFDEDDTLIGMCGCLVVQAECVEGHGLCCWRDEAELREGKRVAERVS